MKRNAVFAIVASAAVFAIGGIVAYPEYPKQIERDYAYAVRVSQGRDSRRLVVYNHCEKSALSRRTRGGDVNRRFCEFAFSGGPVKVDILVCEDVKSYKVFPSRLGLKHSFTNGVISVMLDEPHHFGIQLNDYDKTTLSVLADRPEDPADIPSKDGEGVLYVDGWMDAQSENGAITLGTRYREVYIAPGAVLNARLWLEGPNVRVHGRGMILDPMSDIFRFDQRRNGRAGVVDVGPKGRGAVIEDVKIVDARTFNYCNWSTSDVTFRNVKAFSTMMCSDGISCGGSNCMVDGAWLYVGDNGIVVNGVKKCGTFRDVVIGTSCKAVFPQGQNENVFMENIDVFRADEGLFWNGYNPGKSQHSQSFFLRNVSAVDCNLFARVFACGNMGTLPKTFGFENLSVPFSTGSDDWRTTGRKGGKTILCFDENKPYKTGNCLLAVTNLWVGGRRCDGFGAEEQSRPGAISVSVVNNRAEPAIPAVPNRREVNWTCPYKVWIGSSLQRDVRMASRKKGLQRLEEPDTGANLLADREATRSAWQRCPSWMARLDAIDRDGGAVVYRVTSCRKGAGMYNEITDAFLRRGNGTYRLVFEAQARNGREIPLVAKLLSNEKSFLSRFVLPNDGQWHRYEAEVKTDFDLGVTEMVGLHLGAEVDADEIRFKNLSFAKSDATGPGEGPAR